MHKPQSYACKTPNPDYRRKKPAYAEIINIEEKWGWSFEIEYAKDVSEIKYRKVRNLYVEDIEKNIIACLQKWAFADAFATLYKNKSKINLNRLYKDSLEKNFKDRYQGQTGFGVWLSSISGIGC